MQILKFKYLSNVLKCTTVKMYLHFIYLPPLAIKKFQQLRALTASVGPFKKQNLTLLDTERFSELYSS